MDFLNSVKVYLENELNLFASVIQVGNLLDDNSIAIRPVPSGPVSLKLNGSKTRTYQFQILTKHSNTRMAYDDLEKINDLLDQNKAVTSSDGSFNLINIETYTSPNWVERTDKGQHIFTALYQAELYIKEGE